MGELMNASEARSIAARWMETNRTRWPDLLAAHLVGGITTLAPDAPFPIFKDVDIHLIMKSGSPLLQQMGPMLNVVEEAAEGLAIEAGFKSVDVYATAETVLANPEIAHHLLQDDIVLYDPEGLLASLQPRVREQYPLRKWVEARVNYERGGFKGALGMRTMVGSMYGASGEVNLLGYTHTFLVAALQVSQLQAPAIGGQSLVRMRNSLEEVRRLDFSERVLRIMGLAEIEPERAQQVVDDGVVLFDIAVTSRKTPHPFQHKFHPHLRGYFVDSCNEMIERGFHREAAGWATPFLLTGADIITKDGPEPAQAMAIDCQTALLDDLGMSDPAQLDSRFEQMNALGEEYFQFLGELIRNNPAIIIR